MLNLSPQDVNKLRELLASGALGPQDIEDLQASIDGNPSVPLNQLTNPMPMGSMRNESTGAMTYFNQKPQSMRAPGESGFSDKPYQQPLPAQGADAYAEKLKSEMPKTKIYGVGGGQVVDLGEEYARDIPLDFSRPGIDVPGLGKALYSKDGRYAIGTDAAGNKFKAMLGYDDAASQRRNSVALAQDKVRADIAHTQEATAVSNEQRMQGGRKVVPSGYEYDETGKNLRPIKGGPADFKQAGTFNTDTSTLQSSMADLDRLGASANELLMHKGLGGITGIQGAFPNIPGGKAADAEAKLETLKSQVGFGVLQAMRNASKTGGALGNVSDAEGKRLEANLAALAKAQSIEQFQESLKKIVDFTQGAKDRLANAYNMRYGERLQNQQGQPAQGQPASAEETPPPMEARVVGKTYNTRLGPMVWLGNGRWRKP